jgi:hypothetical protein
MATLNDESIEDRGGRPFTISELCYYSIQSLLRRASLSVLCVVKLTDKDEGKNRI